MEWSTTLPLKAKAFMPHEPSSIKKYEPLEDGILVYLRGDIEFSRSPLLRTELIALLNQKKPHRLVIDLSDVPYMDSSGIATMVEVLQFQRRLDLKLVLCCLQQKVRSMFEISSLDSLFIITDDPSSAKHA